MKLQDTFTIRTYSFDLDWNRHVTSRTYERFASEARQRILTEQGYSIKTCLEQGIFLLPEFSEIRFLGQQFAGSELRVETNAEIFADGYILWRHEVYGEDGTIANKMLLITQTEQAEEKGKQLWPEVKQKLAEYSSKVEAFSASCERLEQEYHMIFSDMNSSWRYSAEALWKVFEEGRFLFFNKVIDLDRILAMDTTSFFMGGEIHYFQMPKPGEKVYLATWIERVDRIRFYFRQDIQGMDGRIYASMRDEQVFVALSTSRPRKAPADFRGIIAKYLEHS